MEQHRSLSHPNFAPGWGPLGLSRGAVGWMKPHMDKSSPCSCWGSVRSLGLLLHWLPTLGKQQAGFLRLRRAPERFISWDDCFSVQMAPAPCELFITGGRNLPAARCRGAGSEGALGRSRDPQPGVEVLQIWERQLCPHLQARSVGY